MLRRVGVERLVLVLIAVVVLAAPVFGSRLVIYNLTVTAIYAIVVFGLNIVLGLAGQVSFAQTVFMAVGGYTSALLTTRAGINPWLALAVGALGAFITSFIVGVPLLRLRGHYLGMATFALALGVESFVAAATPLTNGSIGIAAVPPLAIGSLSFADTHAFYVLSWIVCAGSLALFTMLRRSYVGRAWRAVAAGSDIAASLGIRLTTYKVLAFALSALLASVAGSLYVELTSYAGPDSYNISIIVNIFLMLFIGGRGSYAGPIVGAAILTFVPQLLAGMQQFQTLVFLALLMLLILMWPNGLFGRPAEAAS
jgi:branched-chain amino acid transport system permease protein